LALTLSGVSKKERTERAMQALEQVGIAGEARKKPNELSGGQMQRVAIARSIVNNPEILLADEPTGALDTVTSEQIMKILKDISKNRLVVMVTHNPDIANRYSTRIIKMLDGVVTSDSNPFDPSSVPAKPVVEQPKASDSKVPLRKSKMSFSTALSLSGRNLLTKKSRTIMTSVAGGIGIIGIALILAVSTGVNDYINNLTSDTLSSTPISITSTELNTRQAGQALYESLPAFPNEEEIYVQKTRSVSDYLIKNNITQEYIDYVKKELDTGLYNDNLYKTGLNLDLYGFTPSSPDQ
jgi:putative ABC transport system permease protein